MDQLEIPHHPVELTPWDRVQRARHPQRPHNLDYIFALCEDFPDLHGHPPFGSPRMIW